MQKDYEWVMKCIQSANDNYHLDCCIRLVDFFKNKNDDAFGCDELAGKLLTEIFTKRVTMGPI